MYQFSLSILFVCECELRFIWTSPLVCAHPAHLDFPLGLCSSCSLAVLFVENLSQERRRVSRCACCTKSSVSHSFSNQAGITKVEHHESHSIQEGQRYARTFHDQSSFFLFYFSCERITDRKGQWTERRKEQASRYDVGLVLHQLKKNACQRERQEHNEG